MTSARWPRLASLLTMDPRYLNSQTCYITWPSTARLPSTRPTGRSLLGIELAAPVLHSVREKPRGDLLLLQRGAKSDQVISISDVRNVMRRGGRSSQ
eukprot:9310037-Pyramimonas_sp.AAC.1